MDLAPGSPGGRLVSAAEQVASACRAAARLIAAGLGGLRPTATATAPRAGGRPAEPAALPHRHEGGAVPAATPAPAGPWGTARRPPATATLGNGAPAEGLGVTVAAVAMILLVLTVLTVHGLAGRSAPHRWRSALESARAVGHDLRQRGEVKPVVVLVVVSLGIWSLVILWVLTR
jgi:hypothetical protein